MDWDDLFMKAEEELMEELGREPTDSEISDRAQSLYEDLASAAYDRAKDFNKYGH